MFLKEITNIGGITMNQNHFNTIEEIRKPGKHLSLDERGMIQALHQKGYPLRKIAAVVGCAHSTVYYELKRGTPEPRGNRGRKPSYNAKYGQKVYENHRKNSKRPCKIDNEGCKPFIQWMSKKFKEEHWSIDICVGYARLHGLFKEEYIPCTKTLYNMVWQGKLPLSLMDFPHILSHKPRRKINFKNKRLKGRSIDERPDIVSSGTEIGHWEIDTVVGKRKGREAVIFTAVEKLTRAFIAIRIPSRTTVGVGFAMETLKQEYGEKYFSRIFKTMTSDNGSEFETLSQYETLGTKIYFTHPYSSWERGQNERHNGLLREYIPKGASIEQFSIDDILNIADSINERPRRILGYRSPIELFDNFLDKVYAIDNYY